MRCQTQLNMNRSASYPFLFFISAALLCGCGRAGDGTAHEGEREPVAVRVSVVGTSVRPAAKTFVGTVHPARTAVISSRHAGIVLSVGVRQGQVVGQGETVAVIESGNVRSSYEMASASLAQAEDGFSRAKAVHESGSIADIKMIEAETRLKQARAAFEAAEKALEECTAKAPYSGVVGKVFAETGVSVNVGEPLLTIVDAESPEVRFPVPEGEIGGVREGDEVLLAVPALGVSDARAAVVSHGVTASAMSHSYECTAVPRVKIPGLLPGMVCKVSFGTAAEAVTIPASSVRTDASGKYVWTVSDDDTVRRTPVVTGGFSGNGVIVEEGLSAGDRIIVGGVRKVGSGMKVKTVM